MCRAMPTALEEGLAERLHTTATDSAEEAAPQDSTAGSGQAAVADHEVDTVGTLRAVQPERRDQGMRDSV